MRRRAPKVTAKLPADWSWQKDIERLKKERGER